MTALLQAHGLGAGYDGVEVVHGLDIEVNPGEVVALLGPNGAGKTTSLLTLAGELAPLSGDVLWRGSRTRRKLHQLAQDGLALATEERTVFMRLTTRQNLRVGGCDIARATELFPELGPLMSRRAGLLSGGEQRMLELGRALSRPTDVLLADELSLGLAPRSVGRLLRTVRRAADEGIGALLVEQHVHRVLEIADRVYLLRNGHVEFSGTAASARARLSEIERHYLTKDVNPSDSRPGTA